MLFVFFFFFVLETKLCHFIETSKIVLTLEVSISNGLVQVISEFCNWEIGRPVCGFVIEKGSE